MGLNEYFVRKAEQLTPELFHEKVAPKRIVDVVADELAFQGWRVDDSCGVDEWSGRAFGKGDSAIVDFGEHLVGYVSLKVLPVGSPPDAPLKLKLVFGEMPCEVAEPFESYDGWLSSSWLQEETIFVDVLPAVIRLPRRYCFRYMKVIVLDTSVKYKVSFVDLRCNAVTSGDVTAIQALPDGVPADLAEMDRIGIKTLQDCMQTVFEDGPKRDRRLWIGDLRLQAQANYYTFNQLDLVKRCLYLFGGMTIEGGAVGACVFEKPHAHVDDTLLYDYSLFFVATLYDYIEASGDTETLEELWPVAMDQIRIAVRRLDANGIVRDDPSWYCFTDWHPDLNKQASAQAVLLYCLRRGLALAERLELETEAAYMTTLIESVSRATLTHLWDEVQGYFVSGEDRQVSWASQVWMVLAEALDKEQSAKLLERLMEQSPQVGMNTPYMHHHFIEALFSCGMKEQAVDRMRSYWGEMMKDGADTFWELYNPEDKKLSPYGSNLINSYCHAWSCTPTYFIRKYLID